MHKWGLIREGELRQNSLQILFLLKLNSLNRKLCQGILNVI